MEFIVLGVTDYPRETKYSFPCTPNPLFDRTIYLRGNGGGSVKGLKVSSEGVM